MATKEKPMKVLWFSPVPLPAVCRELGIRPDYGGWWVHSLLREIATHHELELAVAWLQPEGSLRKKFIKDRIHYYIAPDPGCVCGGNSYLRKVNRLLFPLLGKTCDERGVEEAAALVAKFNPDLVHFFGAEHPYGLVAAKIRVPAVVWIQGILDVYRHHYFGSMGWLEALAHPSILLGHRRMVVEARREREIFQRCRYFIGRTRWDAAHQQRLQPAGRYFSVQDCIRPEFHSATPNRCGGGGNCTLYTTTSPALLKGTDVIVRALDLLRARFPEVRLRIAGPLYRPNPVAQRLINLVASLGLSDRVEFIGQLEASKIVIELQQARVFILPSFIENNPNSLAEAQLVGTPVVAAYVGGVPDMVKDDETGLLFQPGDYTSLAKQISRLLTDDKFSTRISEQARAAAQLRYSAGRIAASLLLAYREIIKTNSSMQ